MIYAVRRRVCRLPSSGPDAGLQRMRSSPGGRAQYASGAPSAGDPQYWPLALREYVARALRDEKCSGDRRIGGRAV